MHSTKGVRWAVLLITMLLSGTSVFANVTDDYIPEVTDRVARISFVRGDVQIRRADSQDWEVAVLNLPIVEGDEIATDGNGRFEIQFNSYTHLRVAENSQIKIVGLKDEGIALSVPLGTVVLRAGEFDGSRSYFEIDAPKTTISIQKAGTYRIESGVPDSLEVFVTASDGGEARVYSTDAGFTVKNGRRAKLYIAGNQIGEWETADASRFSDEFDTWSIERDAIIARRVRDSYYDKYYDRDIYGAEDLNDHGEWIYTRKYGYVWRPYQTSISQYSDWSPYRYGQWRWVPPYGWTWVNDESWGWATYHYGRWVWDNGNWYWSPYGYYRHSRSWWFPALVVVRVLGGNVCWYPLPYRHNYYDYNASYYSHHPRRRRHRNNNNNHYAGANPNPSPTPGSSVPVVTPIRGGRDRDNLPPLAEVPPGAVVGIPSSEFGRGKGRFGTPPLAVAQNVLSSVPDTTQAPPLLPTLSDLNGKVSRDIRSVKAPLVRASSDIQLGASPRTTGAPLDQQLQKSRIFGGREPLQINTNQGEIRSIEEAPRKTGAVERPIKRADGGTPLIRQVPPPRQEVPADAPPVKQQEETLGPIRSTRSDPPRRRDEPREQPVRSPKYEAPPPRNDPPPRSDPRPRNDPPPRSDPPKSDPPPKQDPPKSDPKPTPSLGESKKKGDGR